MSGIKSLFLVREGESKQLIFFLFLFLFLGTGMAIGRGSADALFLKRYGVEYLPVMYLILSGVLALSFIAYAAFVDRVSPEKLFRLLLVCELFLLILFWFVIVLTDFESIYPAYFVLYELASEFVIVHAAFYVGQNMNTLQSKRLIPLIFAGYQMGMVIGGLLFATAMPVVGVENSIVIWCFMIALSLILLFAWHSKYGVSPYFIPRSRSKRNRLSRSMQEIGHGLVFIRQSSLLRNSAYALFFMVIMFYVLSFSINKIYSEIFDNERDLAVFFGYLVAATNLIALILQIFISSRVVEKFGVRKTKLIFPVTTIFSYILLLVNPVFYIAIIGSINNGSIMPAFRNPSRQMFFNILPEYMKGRARATSVAIVLPAALFVCGCLILYLQNEGNYSAIIYLGMSCAIMYLWFSYRMGRVYTATLINNMKEKLYFPVDISRGGLRGGSEKMYETILEGIENKNDDVSLSYCRLLLQAFPERAVEPLMLRIRCANAKYADQLARLFEAEADDTMIDGLLEYADSGDGHLKATIYDVAIKKHSGTQRQLIEKAFVDDNPRVRVVGVRGALMGDSDEIRQRGTGVWFDLITGDIEHQLASVELGCLIHHIELPDNRDWVERYTKVYVSLLSSSDNDVRISAYTALRDWTAGLPDEAFDEVAKDLDSYDPKLRCLATGCLHLFQNTQKRDVSLWKSLADGRSEVRKSAIEVLDKVYSDSTDVYFSWLLDNRLGMPRAQKELLCVIIGRGASHDSLEHIINTKVEYAFEILGAFHAMNGQKSNVYTGLVCTVLEERLTQIVDLILMALESILDAGSISVIRAGLNSKDSSHIANSYEALKSMHNDRIIDLINCLIEKENKNVMKKTYGKMFSSINDALMWCVDKGDEWLRQCGSRALKEIRTQ
jgi:hypothetical protein